MVNSEKKCLVLGGAGFLGKHLVEELLSVGYFVRVYDRSDTYPQLKENKQDLIEYVSGDFLRGENFSLALKDIDVVYHLPYNTISRLRTKSRSEKDYFFLVRRNCVWRASYSANT